MFALLALLIGTITYRIPRGGPDNEWWEAHKLPWVAKLNEEIWATAVALSLCLTFMSWWPLLTAPLLWAGERSGYMHWISSEGVDVKPMNLRGALMANPLMGSIYAAWFKIDKKVKLPIWSPFMDGWTAYAEATCGFATTLGYMLLWRIVL
tara:strand:+ start:18020 stop:18472 length:453 start_codon:yes stop_codon:yes gene_type:complete